MMEESWLASITCLLARILESIMFGVRLLVQAVEASVSKEARLFCSTELNRQHLSRLRGENHKSIETGLNLA